MAERNHPRYDHDMCVVNTIKSLLRTVAGDSSIDVPDWTYEERRRRLDELNRQIRDGVRPPGPDEEEELRWFEDTLQRVVDEAALSVSFEILPAVLDKIDDVTTAIGEGMEVVVMDKKRRDPHMYHLGHLGEAGRVFSSSQEDTPIDMIKNVIDHADPLILLVWADPKAA